MTYKTDEEIREEFLNHPTLAGATGYCNPVMGQKIVDFFIAQRHADHQAIVEMIGGDCVGTDEYSEGINHERDRIRTSLSHLEDKQKTQ